MFVNADVMTLSAGTFAERIEVRADKSAETSSTPEICEE